MQAPTFIEFSNNTREIARSNRFLVNFLGPFSNLIPTNMIYHVKTATIPKLDINGPEIKYRGTKMNLRGDIKNDPLAITFYADAEWKIRLHFEKWMRTLIDIDRPNQRSTMKETRFGNAIVVGQFSGKMVRPVISYTYNDVAPFEISEIGLDQGTADGLEEFTVTFHYSFWEITPNTSIPISSIPAGL